MRLSQSYHVLRDDDTSVLEFRDSAPKPRSHIVNFFLTDNSECWPQKGMKPGGASVHTNACTVQFSTFSGSLLSLSRAQCTEAAANLRQALVAALPLALGLGQEETGHAGGKEGGGLCVFDPSRALAPLTAATAAAAAADTARRACALGRAARIVLPPQRSPPAPTPGILPTPAAPTSAARRKQPPSAALFADADAVLGNSALLEHILGFLDGASRARLRRVSTLWRRAVDATTTTLVADGAAGSPLALGALLARNRLPRLRRVRVTGRGWGWRTGTWVASFQRVLLILGSCVASGRCSRPASSSASRPAARRPAEHSASTWARGASPTASSALRGRRSRAAAARRRRTPPAAAAARRQP